jgi:hypothetical protein
MLGHKSLKTTQKYIHVSAAGLRGVADILAADAPSVVAKTAAKVASNDPQKVSPDESEEQHKPLNLHSIYQQRNRP